MKTGAVILLLATLPGVGAAHAGGPTHAYIIEGSGFFDAPGIVLGRVGLVNLSDPSDVQLLPIAADDARFGGLAVRPGTSQLVGFENTTNSLRLIDVDQGGNTLVDSVGWLDSGVAGLAFSNDGSVAYATTAVSGFGRVVRADADTGAVLGIHNFLNVNFSSLAVVPEDHPLFPAGQLWGLGLSGTGGLRVYQLDLDTNTVLAQRAVTGLTFNAQFETGLDWAADGTLYALIQGFRQLGPNQFEEVSSNLYTLDPGTGVATALGVVQADGTWDGASIALIEDPGCPADLTGDGDLNFFDLAAYLDLYNAQDPAADLAEPFGAFNFFDIAAYLDLYNAGCP